MNDVEYKFHLQDRKKDAKIYMDRSKKIMDGDIKTNFEIVGAAKNVKEKRNEKS